MRIAVQPELRGHSITFHLSQLDVWQCVRACCHWKKQFTLTERRSIMELGGTYFAADLDALERRSVALRALAPARRLNRSSIS